MPKQSTQYKNEFKKQKYDSFLLMLPKGKKEELMNIAKDKNLSLNAFINSAIDFYIAHK